MGRGVGILGSPEKPSNKVYLINVIPQDRRWGVIHQAVYWRDAKVIRKLLQYDACDQHLLTKPCTSEKIGVTERLCPERLAEEYGYDDIEKVFKEAKVTHKQSTLDTLWECKGTQRSCKLNLLEVAIAAYKPAFHPTKIDKYRSVLTVLEDIWKEMLDSRTRFEQIRDMVAESVYLVDMKFSENIKECKSVDDMCRCILRMYTTEDTYLYTFLGTALRRNNETKFMPSGEDLALGPYAVVYQMQLLFWPCLSKETGLTYRRMNLSTSDIRKYKVGVKFFWPAVVSSSIDEDCAVAFPTCGEERAPGDSSALFKIDNSRSCRWQPRNIEAHARYQEKERTYPAGAKFEVVKNVKQQDTYVIELKLLPQ